MTNAAERGRDHPGLPGDYAELRARVEDQNVTWDVMAAAA